jgi:Putative Flp pilus-assembly TadE/G-like
MSGRSRGQVLVIMTIALPVVLGVMALCTDVAVMYWNWEQLQRAADSAVLAGATFLPTNPDLAKTTAVLYAENNGIQSGEIDPNYPQVSNGNADISIRLIRTVPYYFGKVIGLTSASISANASAGVVASSHAWGIVPIGLPPCSQSGNGVTCTGTGSYQTYQQVTLQPPGGNMVAPGNYESLSLSHAGGAMYEQNIINGYQGTINVGDWLTTETGNLVGPTRSGFDTRLSSAPSGGTDTNHPLNDPQVIEVPIVDFSGINGNSQVPVLGFAELWVDHVDGNGTITAEFITQVASEQAPSSDPSSQTLYGSLTPILLQ